jgi:hypothetical protein
MHTTIISVGPSELEQGLIWVGTDDGHVQITRDGGGTWENVRDNVDGLPEGIWIPDVQPSRHVAGRAYLVAEDHRRGDWTPHVYVTEDYGEHWTSLGSADIDAFVHAIEEDPENPELLFLGTEFGLRVSFDRGSSWQAYTSGVPAVPIRDLLVHPRDGDLVLGTHGRALIVLDDIRPLRALAGSPETWSAPVQVFTPPPAYNVFVAEAIGYRSTGHAMQQAETRATGALITFWAAEGGAASVSIADADGATVFTRTVAAHAGANRFQWGLRPGGDADQDVFPPQMTVFPGTYEVTVSKGDASSSTTLEVRGDPRTPPARADLVAQRRAVLQINALSARMDEARDAMESALNGVETVLGTLDADAEALRSQGRTLMEGLRSLMQEHFTGPECQGLCRGAPTASMVSRPMGRILGEAGGPSANTRHMMDQAMTAAELVQRDVAAMMDGDVARYRAALQAAGYTPFGGDR